MLTGKDMMTFAKNVIRSGVHWEARDFLGDCTDPECEICPNLAVLFPLIQEVLEETND